MAGFLSPPQPTAVKTIPHTTAIPPSVVAVVLSVQTGLSARKLFIGGILPGIVLLGLFIVTTALCARFRPGWAPAARCAVSPKATGRGFASQ